MTKLLDLGISKILSKTYSIFTLFSIVAIATPFTLTSILVKAGPTSTVPGITISKLFDGTAPFDAAAGTGNDTIGNNDIVRAGQGTGYKFDLSLNDPNAGTPTPYNNYTFTTNPLPLGFRWQNLPLVCSGPGSALTGDGVTTQQVMVCNMGTKNTGDVFTLNATVFTLPTVINNTTHAVGATVSVSGTTNTTNATGPVITATVKPKLDLQKSGAQFFGSKVVGGQPGGLWTFGLGIKLKPGSEPPTLPITFQDDISAINPQAKLFSCGVSGTYDSGATAWMYATDMPLGKVGQSSAWVNTTANAVQDSGTISCTPQSGNSQIIDISLNGVATNPATYPTTKFAPSYAAVSPGDNWIVSDYVTVWIPYSEFTTGNNFNFQGTNKFNNFNPTGSVSGAVNYLNVNDEPGRNLDNNATASNTALTGTEDWYTQIFYRPSPGSFDKADYRFVDNISTKTFESGNVTDGSTWGNHVGSGYRSGDGVAATGGAYTAINFMYFNGVIDIPAGFTQCTTVDNRYVTLDELPGHPGQGAFVFGYAPNLIASYTGLIMEYGVGGNGGVGSQWPDFNSQKTATCENNDSTGGIWYTDFASVPGGENSITKVRMRFTNTLTVAEQLDIINTTSSSNVYTWLTTRLKVKANAAPGTIVPNYHQIKDPSNTWFNGWYPNSYDASTGLNSLGDRITVVGTRVRIEKTVNTITAETQTSLTGTNNTWYLQPTSDALGVNPPGQSANVTITDTIPAGLNYTPGSSICMDALPAVQPVSCEPAVTINVDGTTTLIWDFGTFTAGSAMTKISFDTTSDATVGDGETRTNSVVIAASNDNSPVAWRTNSASVVFVNPAAFAVQKKVLTPFVPIGDPITYRLIAKNTGTNPVNTTDFIDWLPWNGDSRVPASTFSGTLNFTSLTNVSGAPATQIRYTKYPRASLSLPADLDPQTASASIVWCTGLTGGTCPANNSEVTGFRLETGVIAPAGDTVWDLVVTPTATSKDKKGDIITNRFKGRVDGLTLPIESNNVYATVTAGKIGDTIYWDRNGNGVQDSGEPGIPGVIVNIKETISGDPVDCNPNTPAIEACPPVVTDSQGKYSFDDLYFKDYQVVVTPPSGYIQTGDPDSTINNQTVLTVSNTSPATRTNLTGDFGYGGSSSFGDRVWEDRDADGVQDPGESNIANAQVNLVFGGYDGIFGNADDVNMGNILTDTNGKYLFNNLPPGNYRATLNPASVPGLTPTTPVVINHTLALNENYTTGDFGLQYNTVIGDTVYYDVNGNGTQDAGEPGIPGFTVTLKDANGNDIDSDLTTPGTQPTATITNANGEYSFDNLPFGTYKPVVTPLAGFVQTGDPDTTLDNTSSLTTSATILNNLGGDFGYRGTGSFGDRVWVDQNNNQTQDAGETLNVQGASVTLVFAGFDGIFGNADDVTYPAALTNSSGNYLVSNLPAGNYKATLDMSSIPGAIQTTPIVNNKTLANGENYVNGDFGVKYGGGIGDTLYFDVNGNGTQDANEPGISGVLVTLKDATGNDIDSDPVTAGLQPTISMTSATGQYTFTDLPYTTYQVVVGQPSNYPTQTGDPDALKDNKSSVSISVANPVNLAQDFGYRGTASIGDKVWYDVDGDGIQDANEVGIAGAVVSIKWAGPDGILGNADDVIIATATTDANGNYNFTNLPAGNYSVTINPASVLGSVTTTPTTVTQSLTNGQAVTTVDFGLRGAGTIGNLVWKDFDKDGLKDTNEPGLAGAIVNLYQDLNGNGAVDSGEPLIQTVTTGTNGAYIFSNLITEDNNAANGTGVKYLVSVATTAGSVLLGGLAPTILGTANTNDNNQNAAGYSVNLNPAISSNTTADFGFLGNASFGDKVWFDVDGDGVQDPTEPGVLGATVTLIEAGLDGIFGNADDIIIGTVLTDPNGNYIFDKLIPGNYRATINPSSVNGSTATTPVTVDKVLSVGEVYQGGDFGLKGAGTIGNFVWIDTNMDGIAQPTETGLSGVTVELYDDLNGDGIIQPNEPKIATAVTDSTGKYTFPNLLTEDNNPANGVGIKYIVKIDPTTLPANTPATAPGTVGVDNTNQNSAGTGVNLTPTISINDKIDFGFLGQAGVKIDKTVYAGHTAGAGCPGGDELLIVDKTRAQKDVTYCFTVTNTGSTYLKDLKINDPQLSINETNMTLLTGTFPLAPGAKAVWYYQNTTNTSLDNTATVTGTPSNSAGVPTTQANVTDTDLLAKLIYVFDPPIGIKTGTYLGANVIRWTMTWINTAQVTATDAIVSDPIPEKTTYNGNLVCTGAGVTTVTSCNYEAPSSQYPRGRVLVVSSIGPDVGGTTAENSANELQISFDVLAAPDAGDVSNQAKLSWQGFDEPSQAPNTGGPTKVVIPKGIENLIRTGGYTISQNVEWFIIITITVAAISRQVYNKKKNS
jgi:uncharacterized repeat protein (TIGR01451 family)